MRKVNLIGKQVGNLTVLKRLPKTTKHGHSVWLCKCICGSNIELPYYSLSKASRRMNSNLNCGCISNKSTNTFIVKDGFACMYDNKQNMTLIDIEDIPKLKEYYWYKNKSNNYWVQSTNKGCGELLHRFIMNPPKGYVVDHINHDTDDQRKSQLRICTPQQNQFNKIPLKRKYDLPKGIYPTPYGKFNVMLRTKEVKCSKNVDTLQEAINLRNEWEEQYLKNYKYTGGVK